MEAYLDHNATTSISPKALDAMVHIYGNFSANPSSIHAAGRKAKARYLKAKDEIAFNLSIPSKELFFTQSATESLNWILFQKPYRHIVSTSFEHAAIHESLKKLEKSGTKVTYLAPKGGLISSSLLEESFTKETDLVIMGSASSETGILQDIEALALIAKNRNIPFFVDAVGHIGKAPFKVFSSVTGYVIASHKIHGPSGIALLTHKSPANLSPLLYGGHQEHDKKAGTENLAAICGFAEAIKEVLKSPEYLTKVKAIRDDFEKALKETLDIEVIGENVERVYNTSCIRFKNISGETLLHLLDEQHIYASHGSACASGALEPSRTLLALGLSYKEAKECIRFSFDATTSYDEINYTISTLQTLCQELLSFSKL